MVHRPLLIFADALENLGDLALLHQGVMAAQGAGREAYVWQWTLPSRLISQQIDEFGCVILPGKSVFASLRMAVRSDAVIGGGQIVRDNVTPASLAFMLVTLLVVRLRGGRVSTWGLGISEIKRPVLRVLWRAILSLSDTLRVRDSLSGENLRRLRPNSEVVETADMVFLPTSLHDLLSAASNRPRSIVVAPCIEASEARSIDGIGFWPLISHIRALMPDASVVLACHDPRPEIDGGAADMLIQKYNLPARAKLDDGRLSSLCDAYRNAAIVITNRLHASIFALLAGVPLIIIEDGSAKMRALAHMFGLKTVDVAHVLGDASTAEAVRAAFAFDVAATRKALANAAAAASTNLAALHN